VSVVEKFDRERAVSRIIFRAFKRAPVVFGRATVAIGNRRKARSIKQKKKQKKKRKRVEIRVLIV